MFRVLMNFMLSLALIAFASSVKAADNVTGTFTLLAPDSIISLTPDLIAIYKGDNKEMVKQDLNVKGFCDRSTGEVLLTRSFQKGDKFSFNTYHMICTLPIKALTGGIGKILKSDQRCIVRFGDEDEMLDLYPRFEDLLSLKSMTEDDFEEDDLDGFDDEDDFDGFDDNFSDDFDEEITAITSIEVDAIVKGKTRKDGTTLLKGKIRDKLTGFKAGFSLTLK